MTVIQSSIELADRAQRRIFVVSIIFGVVAALIAALLAWLVWNANDKYQDALKTDADARIAEAGTKAAVANAEAAKANEGLGKSNAEIARLTNEAEQAKADRAEANKQIAIAKADAARAKEGIASAEARSTEASAEVSRLRVVVANAEERRAEAETALLELQERIKDRHLTPSQRRQILEILKANPAGEVALIFERGDPEAVAFARDLRSVLQEGGWKLNEEYPKSFNNFLGSPKGLFVEAKDAASAPAAVLLKALSQAGLHPSDQRGATVPFEGLVVIAVAGKP